MGALPPVTSFGTRVSNAFAQIVLESRIAIDVVATCQKDDLKTGMIANDRRAILW